MSVLNATDREREHAVLAEHLQNVERAVAALPPDSRWRATLANEAALLRGVLGVRHLRVVGGDR
jgi:hypothetical protein